MFDTKDISSQRFIEKVKILLERSDDAHNTYTPLELCQEVVNKVPSLDGEILVVANLEFVYTLMRMNVPVENIHFATPCPLKANAAKSLLAEHNVFMYNGVITKKDVGDMKFDVVVGNPPYQSTNAVGERKSKKDNLWSRFLSLSLDVTEDGGYMALIHPGSWMSPSSGKVGGSLFENTFKANDLQYVNTDVAKYFSGVGVGLLTWYVLRKSPGPAELTIIDTPSGTITVALHNFPFVPNVVTTETLSLTSKFFTSNEISFLHSTELNTYDKRKTYLSKTKDREYKFTNIHTGSQKLYSNIKHTIADEIKVMIPLSGYPKPIVDSGRVGMTHVVMYRIMPNLNEANNLASIINSKLYQFMLLICKWSGFNSKKVIEILPLVDLTRSWTDEELYEHFNLTEEEIKLIEDTIK